MKRVIVTGATSMIGIALLGECLEKGVEVIALVRKDSANLNRIPKSDLIRVVECGLDELAEFPVKEFENVKIDVFYHFGWESTAKQYRDDAVLQNLNIIYTLEAVRLASKLGCDAFVGSGSQAEYGRVENVISPQTSVSPDIAYGVAKYAAGKLSATLCKSLGIRHVWGRIFSVYGLHDNKDTMLMYLYKTLNSNISPKLTKCEQMWDYLYSKDAGLAFFLMGEKGTDQSVYCVGSGFARPLSDYVTILQEKMGSHIPLGIGELEYGKNQVMYLCADISSLQTDTGFEPRYKFEEGIVETLQWLEGK